MDIEAGSDIDDESACVEEEVSRYHSPSVPLDSNAEEKDEVEEGDKSEGREDQEEGEEDEEGDKQEEDEEGEGEVGDVEAEDEDGEEEEGDGGAEGEEDGSLEESRCSFRSFLLCLQKKILTYLGYA